MLLSAGPIKNAQHFKDHYQERRLLIRRSITAFAMVLLLMAGLLARGWYLQVVRFEDYQTRSNNNRISVQPLAPKRGLIFDRNDILLAENRSVYTLEIIPEQVKDMSSTLSRLQSLGLIEQAHREAFAAKLRGVRRFKSVSIKTRLSEQEVATFSVNRHKLRGVRVEARLVRHYPFGEIGVHALGYVGRINDQELARIDQANYKATRHIGKVGLEKFYESRLHGKVGFRRVESNVQGRVEQVLSVSPPVPGDNLRLSLDIHLQQAAEAAVEGFRASVVAVDPQSGEVLALVSKPGYNPNQFVTGISTKDYNKVLYSLDKPMFNRALRGLYSPGSTIKPLLGWLGLHLGTITAKTTIDDPGYWVIPNDEERVYRDHISWGHGKVDLNTAIVQSCDPYFYQLAYKMGIDKISQGMAQFGFGRETGIDMGEEVPGILPSREWKRKTRQTPWFPGETVITGIGQGYWNATPLQLANAIAQLAAGGSRYRPHLVISSQMNGEPWQEETAESSIQQADFDSEEHLNIIHRAMEEVNKDPYGTARKSFRRAAYTSAGKTGTVQLTSIAADEKYDATKISERFRDNAMYVGYAPADNPQIALAVIVENAGHGGESAAPVGRKILDAFFAGKQ